MPLPFVVALIWNGTKGRPAMRRRAVAKSNSQKEMAEIFRTHYSKPLTNDAGLSVSPTLSNTIKENSIVTPTRHQSLEESGLPEYTQSGGARSIAGEPGRIHRNLR
jgi:hypothetical protein